VETKSSQRFAEMFSAKPAVKKEPKADKFELSDNFSDDDFAALGKKPAAKATASKKPETSRAVSRSESQSEEPIVIGRGKRAAASKARTLYDDGSDSDGDDDQMLGDIGALVKGISKPAEEPSGRLSLYAMNRPESSHGNGGSQIKAKPKTTAKTFDFDSPDDTNYEMLAKSSPQKPPAKDDVDDFLSDDESPKPSKPVASANTSSSSQAPAGLATVKKARGRPAGTKKAKEEPKPKAVAKSKAAAKQTVLSPAAKAYANKKATKKAMDDDSDEEMEDIEPDSPPPKAASRGRPGRAAAARRPIVLDDSSMLDESDDPFEMGSDDD
jgi:DNA topoisomerase-2